MFTKHAKVLDVTPCIEKKINKMCYVAQMNFDLNLGPILRKVHYIFVIPCLKK